MRSTCLISCIFVLTAITASSELAPVTCEAGSYQIGDDASVACSFGVDISNTNHSFEIMRYPFQSDSDIISTGIDVLRCHRENGQWQCDKEKGVNFDYDITDNVIVTIPNITNELAGAYACQLIPSDGRSRHKCSLFVGDTSWTELTQKPPASGDKKHNISQTKDPQLFIIVIILGVLLGASVALNVVVCLMCRRSRKHAGKRKSKTNGKEGFVMPVIGPVKDTEEDETDPENIQKPDTHAEHLLRTRLLYPDMTFKPKDVQKSDIVEEG